MTVTSGFFNSVNRDRVYSNIQMGQMFDGIINDGVFRTYGDALMVSPASGLRVSVGTGRAWFNHTWTLNDVAFPLTLDAASASMPRIDAVVLRVDTTDAVRENSIYIKKGIVAGSPSNPTMIKSNGIYEYPLAWIRVNANATSVSAANITNAIGRDTPFVELADNTFDSATLLAQWEAQFNQFIENSTLDPSVLSPITNAMIDNMFNVN